MAQKAVEVMRLALQECPAAPVQKDMLEAWMHFVFEPAARDGALRGLSLLVSADFVRLEVTASISCKLAAHYARDLLAACGVPGGGREEVEHLESTVAEMLGDEVRLWCALSRMGSGSPSADIGFSASGRIPWSLADVLMPPSDDLEAVRSHCQPSQKQVSVSDGMGTDIVSPCTYGCSLLPMDGGTKRRPFLGFESVSEQASSSIVFGLSFLKALGFAKPQDQIIKSLSRTKSHRCRVHTVMSEEGLSQVAMRLYTVPKETVEAIAKSFGVACKAEALARVWGATAAAAAADGGARSAAATTNSGSPALLVEVSADAEGYSVAASFDLLQQDMQATQN